MNGFVSRSKHECRCIHGADLGLHFAAFAPSAAVARAVNGDYVQVLEGYMADIAAAQDRATLRRLQKEAARKLVRATNMLRPAEGGDWPRSLEDYARYFSERFPDMAERAAFFLAQAKAPTASAQAFNAELAFFLAWMQGHD